MDGSMKKLSVFLIIVVLLLLCGCAAGNEDFDIIATTLPVYDFTAAICEGSELTVGRLMADMEPVLTVTNDKGEKVLSIPLVDYALMVKGHYNRDMSDQEYLDRQDEYNLTFFLDENNQWMSAYIYINSWKVVLQYTDL